VFKAAVGLLRLLSVKAAVNVKDTILEINTTGRAFFVEGSVCLSLC
jgi:hypothetical protein